jgi:hypothetical protein
MPKTTQPPPTPIRLTTNTIWEGKFYAAGEPLPVASVEELTDNLKPLVITGEPEAEEPNEARGSFQLNTVYELTDDNRLGRIHKRSVQRQIAELEAENAEADWIEEEVANAELPPEIVESLEESHADAVEFAKAQAAAAARAADEASDAAAAASEPPTLLVPRGDRHYQAAHKARLRPAEPVFVRKPDGHFECIGETDGHSQLPDFPITL